MSEIELKLNEEELGKHLEKAILLQLDEKSREQVISKAIQNLKWKSDGYGRSREISLNDYFQDAVKRLAVEVVQEIVREDPQIRGRIKEMVGSLFAEAVQKTEDFDGSGLRNAAALAIIEVLRSNRGD